MTVLDRSELQASPLADLHLIADQIGLEGFRRLRKADLIDAILGEQGPGDGSVDGEDGDNDGDGEAPVRRSRARRPSRSRRAASARKSGESDDEQEDRPAAEKPASARRAPRTAGTKRDQGARARGEREKPEDGEGVAEGVVEVMGNGSAFLRLLGPEPSDGDVYISAAQVRRCELVSGDRVSGPVRVPRRSERHPSLVRIETINGDPADAVAEGTHYDELAVSFASERLAFDSEDPTLKAIEWLTPLGRGSRATIAGGARSGKSETLRAILGALAGREGLELSLVLASARPEELAQWREGPVAPAVALTFAASPEARAQAIEPVIETAKRIAARGGDAVVLIDGLDGLPPHSARKLLAAARKLTEGGSLTVIATAAEQFGGETTVIALDAVRANTGRLPALDLVRSGTLKPELLVGEDGAQEITRARATAAEG
jgi:transcription termination factor Rho